MHENYSNKEKDSYLFDATDKDTSQKKEIIPKDILTENKQKFIPEINYEELTDEQAKIVKLLENGSLLADEIADLAEIDVTNVLTILTELELFGIVEAQAGKRYSL